MRENENLHNVDYVAGPEVIGRVDQFGEITIGGLLHRRGWVVQIVPPLHIDGTGVEN